MNVADDQGQERGEVHHLHVGLTRISFSTKCTLDRFNSDQIWKFQKCRLFLSCLSIAYPMLEKTLCSNIAPSPSSGPPWPHPLSPSIWLSGGHWESKAEADLHDASWILVASFDAGTPLTTSSVSQTPSRHPQTPPDTPRHHRKRPQTPQNSVYRTIQRVF